MIYFMTGMGCILIMACVSRVWLRRRQDYRKWIEPELNRQGYKVIEIKPAPMFQTGPFPKLEIRVGGIHTRTPLGRGEYSEYRIVQALDLTGQPIVLWCKLEFEAFRFKQISWKLARDNQ